VLGLLVTGVYFTLPSKAAQDIVYFLFGLVITPAIICGVHINRPSRAAPWYLLALAMLLTSGGDLIWNIYELVLEVEPPYPSIADIVYLCAYPVWAVALFGFVAIRTRAETEKPSSTR
jgi:hypothetical protein